jgi:hypothetical protein
MIPVDYAILSCKGAERGQEGVRRGSALAGNTGCSPELNQQYISSQMYLSYILFLHLMFGI